MKKNIMKILENLEMPVFKNIDNEDLVYLKSINAFRIEKYKRNNIIFHTREIIHEIGIVISGNVIIENNDLWGNKTILSIVTSGQVFGESYAYSHLPLMVNTVAADSATILFFDLNILDNPIYSNCSWQDKIIRNLLRIATRKNIILSNRSFCTAPKTIRGRLSIYFSGQSTINNSNEFDIPFNRQQMADFLNLDRSALSKELCKMRNEGLIDFNKNHFIIYNIDN